MAKFNPCAPLPNPLSTQAVVKSQNRYGCYYRRHSAFRKRFPGPSLFCSTTSPFALYGRRNWLRFRQLTQRWRYVLTPAQRDAWDTLAGLVPYRNYYGSTGLPGGWQLFFKFNRIRLQQGQGMLNNPPAPWNALEVPNIIGWSLVGNDLILLYPGDFNPNPNLSGGAVISRHPMPGSGRFPNHYWTNNQLTWGFNGVNWITDAYLDCPFFTNSNARSCTVGVFHQRTDTGHFTDFKWIRLP